MSVTVIIIEDRVHTFIPYVKLTDEQRSMVDSEDWGVRRKAARSCYGLDKLIDDPVSCVRAWVAWQGYGLDVLVNDHSQLVREAVSDNLYRDGYDSIDEWAMLNPNKCKRGIK